MASTPTLKENPQFGVGQFGANAAFDGLVGLRYAWGTTFGLVLPNIDKALAQLNKGGGLGGPGAVGPGFNLFNSASLKMLEEIGHGLTHTQAAAAERYITEAWAFEGIGAVIERMAEDAVHSRKLIRQRAQPREVIRVVKPNTRAQLRPIARRAEEAERRAEAAEKRARALEKRVAHLERKTLHPNDGIVVGLPPRVGVGERDIERIKAGLRKVSKYGTLAFFLALLAKALEKMRLGWLRCSNVNRYGRHLCGMNNNLLEGLIADALLVTSLVSIVELAKELQTIEDEVVRGIRFGVRELKPGFTPVAGKLH